MQQQSHKPSNNWKQTYLTEPGPLLPKQGSLSNATRVHTAEWNAGAFVISSVQFRNGHHVANFGVFVCLSAEEGLAISHGNGFLCSCCESRKVAKVCLGVNESTTWDVHREGSARELMSEGSVIEQYISDENGSWGNNSYVASSFSISNQEDLWCPREAHWNPHWVDSHPHILDAQICSVTPTHLLQSTMTAYNR